MKSTDLLHAYNFTANPRKPAQNLAFARQASRKFGLRGLDFLGFRLIHRVMAEREGFEPSTPNLGNVAVAFDRWIWELDLERPTWPIFGPRASVILYAASSSG